MSLPIRILKEAFEEAAEAAVWYDRECPGLGNEFFAAVEAVFDLIEDGTLPLLPMPNKTKLGNVKRVILNRFPFEVVVLERPQEKIIIAVAHQARIPGYWRGRIT